MVIEPGHIAENIREIREKIAAAAEKSGRREEDIVFVAVSKTFPPEALNAAYLAGITDFGESYMQEALDKQSALDIDVRWHFIGHLQKNKVRQAVKHFSLIQSVDSVSLMERIDRIAGEEGKVQEILLQTDLVGEETKFGIDPGEVFIALEKASKLKNILIKGLMIIPPFYDDPEENRENFRRLKEMSLEIDKKGFSNWEGKYLSMGMTDDFEIAIEEGSNMIRTGRAVFGPRRR